MRERKYCDHVNGSDFNDTCSSTAIWQRAANKTVRKSSDESKTGGPHAGDELYLLIDYPIKLLRRI